MNINFFLNKPESVNNFELSVPSNSEDYFHQAVNASITSKVKKLISQWFGDGNDNNITAFSSFLDQNIDQIDLKQKIIEHLQDDTGKKSLASTWKIHATIASRKKEQKAKQEKQSLISSSVCSDDKKVFAIVDDVVSDNPGCQKSDCKDEMGIYVHKHSDLIETVNKLIEKWYAAGKKNQIKKFSQHAKTILHDTLGYHIPLATLRGHLSRKCKMKDCFSNKWDQYSNNLNNNLSDKSTSLTLNNIVDVNQNVSKAVSPSIDQEKSNLMSKSTKTTKSPYFSWHAGNGKEIFKNALKELKVWLKDGKGEKNGKAFAQYISPKINVPEETIEKHINLCPKTLTVKTFKCFNYYLLKHSV